MVINFKDIPFYYLNYEGYTDRRTTMDYLLNSWGVNYTRIPNNIDLPLRQNRISMGCISLLEYAIDKNIFPFIATDDDMNLIDHLPDTIDIPEEANIIFLGGSLYECGGIKPNMYIKEYNNNFYRTYYMLSLNPVLIPNIKSAQLMIGFLKEALQNNEHYDITITMHSKEHIFLTPKEGPYFYQNNYNEPVTKFLWRDNLNKYL